MDCVLESDELKNKVNTIFIALRAIKESINKNIYGIDDLATFRIRLTDVQEKIHGLRINCKLSLEALKKEEKKINEELDYYNQKMQLEWCVSKKPVVKENPTPVQVSNKKNAENTKTVDRTICKEAKEFLDFVAIHGHDDGWLDRDHQMFLKYRKKYNIDIVIMKLQALMPDLSASEIRKHDRWYQKYSELQKKKKEAITNWKRSVKNIKEEEIEIKKVQEKTTKKNSKMTKDVDIKEKLKEWKAEKEDKLLEQIKLYNLQQAAEREIKEKEKEKHEELRMVVSEWKRRKRANKELKKFEKNTREINNRKMRIREARKMIKEFQQRDRVYIEKMQNVHKKPEPTVEEKRKSIIKVPSKLFEPTEQWLHRVCRRKNEPEVGFKTDGYMNYVKYIPKLHVPEWRKQVPTL